VWNQTRRSRWVRGYQPRWILTLGASPAASPSGSACRWSVRRWTRTRIEEKRGLGVWVAHQERLEQLGEVGEGWNRQRAWWQAPAREERERRIPHDWAHSSSLPSTRIPNLPIRISGATQRRSGWSLATARGSARARVSVPARKFGEGEGIEILGLIHGGGSDFIDNKGWRPPSCTSSNRRWIGCLPELHRAASSRGRRRPESVWWRGPVLVVGWAVSWTGARLRQMGRGQVSNFFFSSASFLFFYFLFSVLLFLIQVLIYFCRFWTEVSPE
jgi:hypothetical protein